MRPPAEGKRGTKGTYMRPLLAAARQHLVSFVWRAWNAADMHACADAIN